MHRTLVWYPGDNLSRHLPTYRNKWYSQGIFNFEIYEIHSYQLSPGEQKFLAPEIKLPEVFWEVDHNSPYADYRKPPGYLFHQDNDLPYEHGPHGPLEHAVFFASEQDARAYAQKVADDSCKWMQRKLDIYRK